MTEAEITLAVENDIPKITDTVSVAKQKLDHMRTLIRNAARANLGLTTGSTSPAVMAPAPTAGNGSVGKYTFKVKQ
jgi:hypothetical protein